MVANFKAGDFIVPRSWEGGIEHTEHFPAEILEVNDRLYVLRYYCDKTGENVTKWSISVTDQLYANSLIQQTPLWKAMREDDDNLPDSENP